MGIIAILSMSYITTRIVKTYTSVAKISRVPVEYQITTLSVVKIAIKFSLCDDPYFVHWKYITDGLKISEGGPSTLSKMNTSLAKFRNCEF